ncbi:MAG: TAXI family TRAP transporter solute-binding subunit [Magnetovibrio sp.]|nr:TAXI family TRAP transporter solute-binding subunit [Magnetovibrio sp.]
MVKIERLCGKQIAARMAIWTGALTFSIFSNQAFSQDPIVDITIGTGGHAGVYFPTGEAICKSVNKNTIRHNVRCSVIPTNGSIENISMLQSGTIDFGIVQSDIQFYAVRGYGPFKQYGPDQDLRAVLSLFAESFTVVARVGSGIKRLNDLKGKRVNIGNPGSGQRADMDLVMAIKRWKKSDFERATELTSDQQGKALCANKIDAFVFTAGHPNHSIKATAEHCDVEVVQAYDATIKTLVEKYPYYVRTRIPAGAYKGTTSAIPTFGIKATLVATSQIPDKIVKTVVQSIFDDFIDFRFQHSAFFNLKPDEMVRTKHAAPLHPGAALYFGNMGYNPKVDKVKAPKRY